MAHLLLRAPAMRNGRGQVAVEAALTPEAVARLRSTGAAAGFELACAPADADDVFGRFARILEAGAAPEGIAITHRYLGVVAVRP